MDRKRIGEFTPLGFIIGFALCLGLYGLIFVNLSFHTVAPNSVPTKLELNQLSEKIERNQKRLDDVETTVKSLESLQKKAAGPSKPTKDRKTM